MEYNRNQANDKMILDKIFIIFIWVFYGIIFNFVGSVIGWCCAYILIVNLCGLQSDLSNIYNLSLLVLSLLGITGHLPQSLYGVVSAIAGLTDSLAKKIVR